MYDNHSFRFTLYTKVATLALGTSDLGGWRVEDGGRFHRSPGDARSALGPWAVVRFAARVRATLPLRISRSLILLLLPVVALGRLVPFGDPALIVVVAV